jgi:hypothetical protein
MRTPRGRISACGFERTALVAERLELLFEGDLDHESP